MPNCPPGKLTDLHSSFSTKNLKKDLINLERNFSLYVDKSILPICRRTTSCVRACHLIFIMPQNHVFSYLFMFRFLTPNTGLCIFQVQVWDTAGQERFRKSMVEHYYRNVHAVVFVYDVTKMTSFTNLKMWIQECNGHAVPPLVPKVLVGNKCDLREQIQVPSNLALKFADAHNMLLFETSAKDPKESQNVESIFMCLACRLKAQKSLLYRDAERQQGKVQKLEFPQEANSKTSCPC